VKTPPPLPRARDKASLLVGKTISERYRIETILAAGGMGTVYRGEHVHMQKRVAIKVLRPDMEAFPELCARFEREAIAGAHVDHPNVASATDFGRLPDGSYFLVLEFVGGITLYELSKLGPVPPSRAVAIARQLAGGLEACHRMGVIHRDLKPRNVMVDIERGDLVKIIDFGLARVPMQKRRVDRPEDDGATQRQITLRGIVFGTVAYMAPETALGMEAVDERSDLYALGVILYELLAGKHPFDAIDPAELFLNQRATIPPPLAERAPGLEIPSAIEAVVRRLLEKNPANRYQSARETIEALDRAMLSSAPPLPSDATPVSGAHSLSIRAALSRPVSAPPRDSQAPAPAGTAISAADATQDGISAAPRRAFPLGRATRRRVLAAAAVALAIAGTITLSTVRSRPAPQRLLAERVGDASADASSRTATATLDAIEATAWRDRFRAAREAKDGRGIAIATLALAERDPTTFRDREFTAPLASLATRMAFEGDPRTDELFRTLGERMGSEGVDVLYEIASTRGGSKGAQRANVELAKPEVAARASRELSIALELRDARCEDKRDLFARAGAEGDARTLRLLDRLRAPVACNGTGQCCYFGNAALDKAAKSILARL
jgi:serine/threonine-protein kinase